MGKVEKTVKVLKFLTNTDIKVSKRECPACGKDFTPKRVGRNLSNVCSAKCGKFVAQHGLDD